MAVRGDATRWSTTLYCGFAIVAVHTGVVRAEPLAGFVRTDVELSSTTSALDSGSRTSQRWFDVWGKVERRVRRSEPDWLRRRRGDDTVDSLASAGDGTVCIVVQEDRPDGTELLTARYTLQDGGTWRTYAGAGLNHAQYFLDDAADLGTTFFTRRNRHSSLGAAAEVGAEMQVSQRVLVTADLRWADLHDRAEALRSEHGPVVADPLLLGVAVGYRFR